MCYRRFHLHRHFARLSEMPWQESRLVTLTLDRAKVGIGADAYMWFREKKALGRFFVGLERQGVEVKDWAGQIEFHKDGTPHWHLLVWTKKGKAGMIGNARLKAAWPWGGVHEDYFKDRAHYDNTVGYFGKSGYFHKGKKYQTELPDYFRSDYFKGKRIARFYSARRKSDNPSEQVETEKEPEPSQTITGRKLATCGQFTHIWFYTSDRAGFERSEAHYSECINVPYNDFVEDHAGAYVPGFGYSFFLSGIPPEVSECPF
ncbi:hypothetical protein C4J81_00380 [Deltaproteobacteria bacterium Smac51]|nr:hypothetical protein C4J81_00300 [Deltaproteobacteria bacterium Smac51]UQZ87754.1 hypothetical protein C4J81_00380 [Deltaproteobacteria bacterium Smac51]